MKPKIFTLVLASLIGIVGLQAQTLTFLEKYSTFIVIEEHMVTDKAGNIYVSGNFQEDITIGGVLYTSAGNYDGFVAKYDPNGNVLWAYIIGGAEYDEISGMVLDKGEGIVICGEFRGTINIGPMELVSAGGSDGYMAAFKPNGNLRYVQTIATSWYDAAKDITIDKEGNKYICGDRGSELVFNGVLYEHPGGYSEGFVAKYDRFGNPIWIRFAPSSMPSIFDEMDVDNIGNICLAGEFQDDINIDGINYIHDGTANFVTKMNSFGAMLWTNIVPGSTLDYPYDLVVDRQGNAYVVFNLYYNLTIDGVTYTNDVEADFETQSVVARFSRITGEADWVNQLHSITRGWAQDVVINNENQLVFSGSYRSNLDYAGTELISTGDDVQSFILTTDLNGNALELYDFGDNEVNDAVREIAFDKNSNMIMMGFSFGTFEIGGYTITEAPQYWLTKIEAGGGKQGAEMMSNNMDLQVYPNPVAETLNIRFNTTEEDMTITIVNTQGQIVYAETHELGTGENVVAVDVTGLPAGIYYLQSGNESVSFIISH